MSNSINTSFGAFKSPNFSPKSPIVTTPPIMPSQKGIPYLPYNNKPKAGPMTDLIETEEEYIEDLKCLLQKVTKSWDRDNPIPQDLDAMFNVLDEIYQKNSNFCSRLKNIGTDLLSAKELGNTLITWVKEMEGPYSAYCQCYRQGVDLWPEIDNNLDLQQTLNVISGQKNKPITLDFLFDLPLKRIHYYKKFYMRILKSSEPGRSDYDILTAAIDRIDNLIELEKKAKETKREENISLPAPQPVLHTFISPINSQGDNIVVPEISNPKTAVNVNISELERKAREMNYQEDDDPLPVPQTVLHTFISPVNSQRDNMTIPDIKANTKLSEFENQTNTKLSLPEFEDQTNTKLSLPGFENQTNTKLSLPEFENQIDTSKVMDLFTKQPKTLNVKLSPPHLPFKREIILNDDFIVILPDGEGSNKHRAHVNAHLVLFTDLLLICQRLTPDEKLLNPTKDFWLLYPPLSGRHLTLNDMYDDKEELMNLVVLEKEYMVLVADNRGVKEAWLKEVTQTIEFAKAAVAKSKINTNLSPAKINTNGLSPTKINTNGLSPTNINTNGLSPTNINTNVSPTFPNSQLSIYTQEPYQMSPSTTPLGNLRTLSPPYSPSLLSPPSPGQKMGLPSSPLSNNIPLSRSRSPDQISNPSPSNFSQTTPNFSQMRPTVPIERSNSANSFESLDSVSSIASFTETIQQTPPCEVSCWDLGEWSPINKKGKCIVEIRMTSLNKPCWAVLLESNERMVLNSWINPSTSLYRESINSLSVSCETGQSIEYYKITLTNVTDTDKLFSNFLKMKNYGNNDLGVPQVGFISRSSSLKNNQQQSKEIEQRLTSVMEAKVKLFLQNNHGIWTNLGWGNMRLLLEVPSHRKRIIIQSDKKKLIDAFVCETGVAKVNKSNVTFKINISDSANVIYMMQMKSEAIAVKALEIMKSEQRT